MVVISDLREQPHFAGIVADRIWHAFWQDSEVSPSALAGRVQESLGPDKIPTAFVAHENEVFLGTASLIVSDQETRPELTPWVAAVWVEPEARRRGTGAALVERAVQAAFALGVTQLYLGASALRRPFDEKRGWTLHEPNVPRPGMAILARSTP